MMLGVISIDWPAIETRSRPTAQPMLRERHAELSLPRYFPSEKEPAITTSGSLVKPSLCRDCTVALLRLNIAAGLRECYSIAGVAMLP